jgi:hypothetical protein
MPNAIDRIVTNNYLELRTDPETGEKRLFGKCGYQTMSNKTDKYTLANMAAIARAMAAGELTDINGEPATDRCVIQTLTEVRIVKGTDQIEQVTSIRSLSGEAVSVPDAPVASVSDNPFGS